MHLVNYCGNKIVIKTYQNMPLLQNHQLLAGNSNSTNIWTKIALKIRILATPLNAQHKIT